MYDYSVLVSSLRRYRVAMLGSGAWACAAVRMMAQNTLSADSVDEFVDEVGRRAVNCLGGGVASVFRGGMGPRAPAGSVCV